MNRDSKDTTGGLTENRRVTSNDERKTGVVDARPKEGNFGGGSPHSPIQLLINGVGLGLTTGVMVRRNWKQPVEVSRTRV